MFCIKSLVQFKIDFIEVKSPFLKRFEKNNNWSLLRRRPPGAAGYVFSNYVENRPEISTYFENMPNLISTSHKDRVFKKQRFPEGRKLPSVGSTDSSIWATETELVSNVNDFTIMASWGIF